MIWWSPKGQRSDWPIAIGSAVILGLMIAFLLLVTP